MRPSIGAHNACKPANGDLHLGFDARRAGDPASSRGHRQMMQQGGLADARLAMQHQHPTLTRSHPGHEPTQLLTLTPTTEQARRREFGEGHPRAASSQLGSPRWALAPVRLAAPEFGREVLLDVRVAGDKPLANAHVAITVFPGFLAAHPPAHV